MQLSFSFVQLRNVACLVCMCEKNTFLQNISM